MVNARRKDKVVEQLEEPVSVSGLGLDALVLAQSFFEVLFDIGIDDAPIVAAN